MGTGGEVLAQQSFNTNSNLLVGQNFASLNLGEALFYLTNKPLIVVHETLNGLYREQFGIPTALCRKVR